MAQGRILLFILTLSLVTAALAQHDQGGFIKPGDSLSRLLPAGHIIYLPQDGFSFYEFPSGAFKGKILPGPPLGIEMEQTEDSLMAATITGASFRPQLLTEESFFETTDARYYLSFDQQKDNHLLVFSDSYHGWIALEEILVKGFDLVNWMEFYGGSKGQMIHPINKIASIYLGPKPGGKIVITADELYSEIETTGKRDGSFCFVKVTQYRNPYDPEKSREENVLKKYKGWIQIIDEAGKLLVAHNERGE